jgi:hypothetical protein
MIDYLIHVPDGLAAHAEAAAQWARLEAGQWVFALPTFCGALKVDAYTDLGSPAETDEVGNTLTQGVAPTQAAGDWIIVSIGNGNPIPEIVAPFVVASGDRDEGLTLPAGVAGLSTIWAGMTVLPHTP